MDWHPLLVHFPVALILAAVVFEWGRWLSDRKRLVEAGFWGGATPLLIFGFMGSLASVATGLWAEEKLPQDSVTLHELVELHETLAFVILGGLATLVFWRVALRGAFPRRAAIFYLIAILVLGIAVIYTAYIGGQMVYVHGAGVNLTR